MQVLSADTADTNIFEIPNLIFLFISYYITNNDITLEIYITKTI